MNYLIMVYEFFKIGLFAVGGGLATLPFLSELGEKYGWFTAKELTNMIAVSESTPGPIGVNMATYVGYGVAGIPGGITTTLSLVLPSVITIIIIAKILERFKNSIVVKDLFYGLRAAVVGLIGVSVVSILMQNLVNINQTGIFNIFDIKKIIVFAALVFGVFKFKKHPLLYIAIGAVCGVLFQF